MKAISTKFGYINAQLAPVRHFNSLKFNSNLFRAFIVPLFMLGTSLYKVSNNQTKGEYCRLFRKLYRRFALLPYNCPNSIVNGILGKS